jgi:hypothetical protein
MNSEQSKNRKNSKKSKLIYPAEVARGMKPGEVKEIAENVYVIPMFVLDPPEPIKKPAKRKSAKK